MHLPEKDKMALSRLDAQHHLVMSGEFKIQDSCTIIYLDSRDYPLMDEYGCREYFLCQLKGMFLTFKDAKKVIERIRNASPRNKSIQKRLNSIANQISMAFGPDFEHTI